MDESNLKLFNLLKIFGPAVFFIIVFGSLYTLTEFGLVLSALIAGVIATLDYFVLVLVMKKVGQ